MFSKHLTIVCLAATLALAPATKVSADLTDGGQGSLNADQQGRIQPVSALPLFNVQD